MSAGIVIGLLIVLVFGGLVVRPLFVAQKERQRLDRVEYNQDLENLLFQREAALAAIRDLELDHAMGKLSAEDFADLNARQRAHAIELIRRLDGLGVTDVESTDDEALDAYIEQAVAEVREGKRPAVSSQNMADIPPRRAST